MRSRRILVVDDNEDAAFALVLLLRTDGYESLAAHDGDQALQQLKEFAPDVALLDIGLPQMDGYELARRIARIAPDVHLVALTGYGQPGDRERSAKAGFVAHLVKPVQYENLGALLGRLLQGALQPENAAPAPALVPGFRIA